MPTIASQPSLERTQAVGAILMHHFVSERFRQAGLGEELIQEAETQENLDKVISVLVQDPLNPQENAANCNTLEASSTSDDSFSSLSPTDLSENGAPTEQPVSESMSSNERTMYHSMNHDATMYHSINRSRASANKLDELLMEPKWRRLGSQLRQLAEEFERDPRRQAVKDKAMNVKLTDLTKENFLDLLGELFGEEITRERIVVLFFFCTDVAMRAASFATVLVVKLMGWSFSYLINTVCRVVHQLGGWDNLLSRQLPSLMVTCCAALGVCAFALFIRKTLKNPT